jgi:hypothetical protein
MSGEFPLLLAGLEIPAWKLEGWASGPAHGRRDHIISLMTAGNFSKTAWLAKKGRVWHLVNSVDQNQAGKRFLPALTLRFASLIAPISAGTPRNAPFGPDLARLM